MGNHKNGDGDSDEAVIVLEGRRESALKDRRGFVLWSVYFMGVVMLLPWNMLINVNYYWDYKVTQQINVSHSPNKREMPPYNCTFFEIVIELQYQILN